MFVRGRVVKHIALIDRMCDLDPDDPFHPSALDAVEIASAGALMRKVLTESDDYRVLIAAARARSMERERAAT